MKDKNYNKILLLVASIAWFVVISYITAQTEYYELIADRLADPSGTSTTLESILHVIIVIVSFMPSGLALAIPYVKSEFTTYIMPRVLLLSFGIAMALYLPFSWYNFAVNFGN